MGRLKNGLLLGSMLGAGLMWLNTTQKGRELKRKITLQAAEVYGDVKERVMMAETWEKLSKSKYSALVVQVVDEYAKKHPLAEQAKDIIVKIVSSQWEHIQTHIKRRAGAVKKQSPRQSFLATKPGRRRATPTL